MMFGVKPILFWLTVALAMAAYCTAAEPAPPATTTLTSGSDPYASERVRAVVSRFPIRGMLSDSMIPPRSPQETVASFKLLPGLKADVVLHEPLVTQPLFLNFDERGRLWVVQFIQYPFPAGLKIVDLGDQFHATYDKVPPAPPKHDRGADRISIHEDTDGDGVFDAHKVFLDGLNMVTSVEHGRGGVWVLNPPYLLFYADANRDDVPDADPVVHLAGFGLEDTHSAANSLRWGPDGWLWGVQGSGVTAKVSRPGIDKEGEGMVFKGQSIWRYHPERRVFELFAEGGGNPFALALDAQGRVFGGTNGAEVRGFHYVQGGFYKKAWGQHGYLTNSYTFGFFGPMEHNWKAPRFTHTYLIYEEGQLGAAMEGRIIAPNALLHRVELSERIPQGSTYRTKDVATFLESDDRWFRPVDVKVGPDGAVYLADWYDTRLTHQDPRDNWDRVHGRVYRVGASDTPADRTKFDLAQKTSDELIALLSHRQPWFRAMALRLLSDRGDRSLAEKLGVLARRSDNPHALDALWGLHAVGGFSMENAPDFLGHPQAAVRMWAVRLIGDRTQPIPRATAAKLEQIAHREPDAQVRSQLAATARRLSGEVALPVIFALADRTDDVGDPHIPLMLWWALEAFTESHHAAIIAAFAQPDRWNRPLVRSHLVPLLARRYASHPTAENQQALAHLAKAAPEAGRALLRQGVADAFDGRGIGKLSAAIEGALFNAEGANFSDPQQMSMAIKQGDQAAVFAGLGFVGREDPALEPDRLHVIQALGDVKAEAAAPALLEILGRSHNVRVREAALAALGSFGGTQFVSDILRIWAVLDTQLRHRAMLLFVSRRNWARELLGKAGAAGVISKADVPDEIAQRARLLGDADVNKLLDRYFGRVINATAEEKQRRLEEISKTLGSGAAADLAAGRGIFDARCAACHKLFGHGGALGPDLTGQERTNVTNMLLSILDPSASIREGYATVQVKTKDERSLVGFIEERDPTRLVLRDPAGQRTSVPVGDIVEERVLPQSLMPEGLLDGMSSQELRDFFSYLTASIPPVTKNSFN